MGKRTHISLFVGLVLGWFLMLTQTSALAQGNLRLGRVMVTTGFKYELRYDDNIFFEAENTQDDVVHILSPSILFGYTGATPDDYFQAGYTGDFALHSDLTDNDWQRHSPFVSAGFSSPVGIYVKLGDSFSWSEDPFGTFTEFDQSSRFGLGEKTERYDNTASALVGYHLADRWFTEVFYNNYLIRYDLEKDKWQNRMDHIASGALFYRITPKTSVLVQYKYTKAEYGEQNDGIFDPGRGTSWSSNTSQDYSLNDFLVGVRFEPGGKISGEAKIGYGNKEFENQLDPQGFKYEDDDDFIASMFVTYRPTTRTSASLNLQRSHLGSPDADAASFVNTLIQFRIRQDFAYRLSGNLMLGYNLDDYQNEVPGIPSKYFNRYTFLAGLDWKVRPWLTAGLEYQYEEQVVSDDAAYGGSEYIRNLVLGYISFTY